MKNVRQIVVEFLETNGFDGLCYPDEPCGCLAENLAPCGLCDNILDCQPGHRKDVDEHEPCECDGQGTKHWHICLLNEGEQK